MLYALNVCFPNEKGRIEELELEGKMYGMKFRRFIFDWLRSVGYQGGLDDFQIIIPEENILLDAPQLGPLNDRVLKWLRRQDKLREVLAENRISSLFGDNVPEDVVHLVIVNEEILEASDLLGDLDARYRQELKRSSEKLRQPLEKLPSPLSMVGSAKLVRDHLCDTQQSIYIDQVPAALFNPLIAQLQFDLQNLDNINPSTIELDRAATLFTQLVKCHASEDSLDQSTRTILEKILGGMVYQETFRWAQEIRPDGHIKQGIFFPFFLEEKVLNGNSGDPILQATIDYGKVVTAEQFKQWRDITNFPVALLGIAGHRIEIAIAVCVGPIYASRIFICDTSKGFHQYENCLRLARAFWALKTCIDSLRNYYNTLSTNPPSTLPIYPDPTPLGGGRLPSLTFQGIISPAGQVSPNHTNFHQYSTALYLAKMNEKKVDEKEADEKEADEKEVVVKFTSRYNAEAHHVLASANYAPKLFACVRVVGNLYMVVMERVIGESVWALLESRKAFSSVIGDEVEKAIKILHQSSFVFGDLRNPNIMYVGEAVDGKKTQERVLLIDFDWAGNAGLDRYPPILNPTLKWAPGVEPFGIMEQEHDLFQVERLKKIGRP